MKTFISIGFLLFISLTGCDKTCNSFVGTWESENYDAYIDIKRNQDVFLVYIKPKSGEPDWITIDHYILYYDNGVLRSDKQAFKTITFNPEKQTIRINDEKDEWHRKEKKAGI